MTQRSLDEGDKETAVTGVVLRVPLDAYGEPGAEHLDGLDAAVVRKSDGLKPLAELVDSLVVMAAPFSLGAKNGGHGGARLEDDPVGAHLARNRPVGVVAHDFGEVLVEGASKADVEQLQAPADGEQGHVTFERTLAKRHLPGVAVLSRRVGLLVRTRPIQARVNVRAASEDQAVNGFEHCLCS
jgi:hypothetical protein